MTSSSTNLLSSSPILSFLQLLFACIILQKMVRILHTRVCQSDSTLPDGKYEPNPTVIVTILISNVDNLTMQHGDSHWQHWNTSASLVNIFVLILCMGHKMLTLVPNDQVTCRPSKRRCPWSSWDYAQLCTASRQEHLGHSDSTLLIDARKPGKWEKIL